jgi:hypothetical protein
VGGVPGVLRVFAGGKRDALRLNHLDRLAGHDINDVQAIRDGDVGERSYQSDRTFAVLREAHAIGWRQGCCFRECHL